MRKFITICALALAAFAGASCKAEEPLFDLAVQAVVIDTATTFHAAADVAVRNVDEHFFAGEDATCAEQAGRDGRKAERFVNRQIKKYIKANIPNDKPYWQVHVKGYVKYIVTVEIDKTFPE